jgi:hypothetical protein
MLDGMLHVAHCHAGHWLVPNHAFAGFALCGFGTGEDPTSSRTKLLQAALSELPADKIRFMSGAVRVIVALGCCHKRCSRGAVIAAARYSRA